MNVTESEGSAILQRAQLEPGPTRGGKRVLAVCVCTCLCLYDIPMVCLRQIDG